jgi:UDP-N-acetylglucosamine--dolichyl-phosphate N-acetylglucosaminephosphotransferase
MNALLFIPPLISFFVALFLLPCWIRKMREIGLEWDDMNKHKSKKVAGSGGIMIVLGFVIGAMTYIAYLVLYLKSGDGFLIEIFSSFTVILILAMIGFMDDLFGWRKGGLSIRSRLILVLLAAVPLIVINAGKSQFSLPWIGSIEAGLFYPILLIPIGVVGATTTYNFLAGFNGLEAGQGVILLSALAIVSYMTGSIGLVVVAICMVAALLAFLIYNFDPAQVFPGDSLTYAIGGLIAIMAILGNFEKIAVFFFIPYIIETLLKSRGRLKKYSFGKPQKDGSLTLRYDKIYSLNHVAILLMEKLNIKPTERKAVMAIWLFQILVILAGFIIFWGGLHQNVSI